MNPTEERALAYSAVQLTQTLSSLDVYGHNPAQWNRIHRVMMAKWKQHESEEPFWAPRVRTRLRTWFSALKSQQTPRPSPIERTLEVPGVGAFNYFGSEVFVGHTTYIGQDRIVMIFDEGQSDLMQQYQKNWRNLQQFLDQKLFRTDQAFYPWSRSVNIDVADTASSCLVISKPKEYVSLQRVLEVKGALDPRHVAWILTRLYYQACLMRASGAINLEISPKNIFINPGSHELVLIGGWQYANGIASKALAAPSFTRKTCPSLVEEGGVVRGVHLAQMIQHTGRLLLAENLGEEFGVPPRLASWLNREECYAAPGDELFYWNKAKVLAFGPPNPIPWDLTSRQLYETPPA